MSKVCANKNCQKPLPEGYKHKRCEACRNQIAQNVKDGLKAVGGIAVTLGCIALTVVTSGKVDLTNK